MFSDDPATLALFARASEEVAESYGIGPDPARFAWDLLVATDRLAAGYSGTVPTLFPDSQLSFHPLSP